MSEENERSYDGFDKSQFFDIIREIQNEIKDKVLTKLLTTVQNQAKEIKILKKENTSLKDHLSYILKRIILNKNDYAGNNQNSLIKYDSSINMRNFANNSAIFKENNIRSNNNMLRPLKSMENYKYATANNFYKPKQIPKNKSNDDYNYEQSNSQIDFKVNNCLNNLYRNNFVNNNGESNDFSLNKKESLFDELFKSKSKIKNKFNTLNYNDNMLTENNQHPEKLKKYSSQFRKHRTLNINLKKNIKYFKSNILNRSEFNDYNIELPKTTKVSNSNKYNLNVGIKPKKKIVKTNKYSGKTYGEKIKAQKGMFYLKRSPFLANKY